MSRRFPLVNGSTQDKWVRGRGQFTCEPRMMRFTKSVFNSLTGHY